MCSDDSPNTLFYLDPPYWGCEDDYGRQLFTRDRFVEMATTLAGLEGKAIVSFNDVPEVQQTFAGFRMEKVDLTYSISLTRDHNRSLTFADVLEQMVPHDGRSPADIRTTILHET